MALSSHCVAMQEGSYVHLCQYTSPIDGVDCSKLMGTPYISISEQFLDKVLAIVKAAIYGYIVYVFIEAVKEIYYQYHIIDLHESNYKVGPRSKKSMTQRVGSYFGRLTNWEHLH